MNRAYEYRWLRDRVTYNQLYGPDEYPEEDETGFDAEVAEIQPRLVTLLETSRRESETTWLRLALGALSEAVAVKEAGDVSACRRKLNDVESLLKDASAKKSIEATMVAGESGTKAKK